ncbi:MAG: hypothetical protein GXO39_10165 [Thermotogae bacterium]|nr:hypothetical protein [Thermotogota bacterium]
MVEVADDEYVYAYVEERTSDYLQVAVTGVGEPQEYKMNQWFKANYGRKVSKLGDDANKLANTFIKKGLELEGIQFALTKKGEVLGDGSLKGWWRVTEGNSLDLVLPVADTYRYVKFVLEDGTLTIYEDERVRHYRLYRDEELAQAFKAQAVEGVSASKIKRFLVGKSLYVKEATDEGVDILQLNFEKDGKLSFEWYNPWSGKKEKFEVGKYRVDALRHGIVTMSSDGTHEEFHRVIEVTKDKMVIQENEGEITYLYRTRSEVTEGITTWIHCPEVGYRE